MGISSSGLLGVTLAVVLAVPLSAQESCEPAEGSAALEGGVHETAAGVALPGATVVANWSGVRTEVVADGEGRFALCDLPAGEALRVQATAAGFASEVVELRLTAGETRRVDLAVSFGAGEAVPGGEAGVAAWERAGFRGRVVGRVLDAETGEAVEAALVGWESGAYQATTGPQGTFRLDRVPAGERTLRVRHLAYGERTAAVAVPANAAVHVELRLAPEPIELEPIAVTVTGVRDLTLEIRGFYERKEWGEKLGLGHFFTREDIERRMPRLITELVADVPSIRLDCARSYRSRTCDPVSVRTPRLYCMRLNVYVDGVRVLRGERSEIRPFSSEMHLDELVNPAEIAAVEVYPSSSSLPAEFAGSTGQCGAVVIWTRTGR